MDFKSCRQIFIFLGMTQKLAFLSILLLFIGAMLASCSDSVGPVSDAVAYDDEVNNNDDDCSVILDDFEQDVVAHVSGDYTFGGSKAFPLEANKYPYAGIPRLMIETDSQKEIADRENYLSAQMRFYGDSLAEGPVLDLQIKGHGNSSWYSMPKHSFRIELEESTSLLGMPKNKDWVLIANYADKTLMKNYLSFRLAKDIGMVYAPRSEFVELYLNGEYQGVYQLTEKIKVGKNRVNISNAENSYLVEFDTKYKENEQVVFSNALGEKMPFRVHSPKNAAAPSLKKLRTHIEDFETFLLGVENASLAEIEEWIDMDAYAKHFWIQEFAKNPDANFMTSVFFTWTEGDVIKMGPVWDFDVAYGGFYNYAKSVAQTDGWRTVDMYWNAKLFSNSNFSQKMVEYWKELRPVFENAQTIVDSLQNALELPAKNNFKRWNVLQEDGLWTPKSYADYDAAVADLKIWIDERMKWMDSNKF